MVADRDIKCEAMEKARSAGNSSYKYKLSADIYEFLEFIMMKNYVLIESGLHYKNRLD